MPATASDTTARLRRYWDKHAPRYDQQMQFFDRKLFGNSRAWICRQASGQVLEVAIGTGLDLQEGDAQALAFPDNSFDTVVCTFSLCAIPDDRQAVAEMRRVLRPGGRLLLADHIAGSAWPTRAVQWL